MNERERQMFEQANRYQNIPPSDVKEPMSEDRNTTTSRPTLRWPDPPSVMPNYSMRPRTMQPQGMGNNPTDAMAQNTMQGNRMQGNRMQGNPVPSDFTQGRPMQRTPMQNIPMQGRRMQSTPIQGNSMQGYSMQGKPMPQKSLQNQPMQGNSMQNNSMQNNLMPGSTTSKYNLDLTPSGVKMNTSDNIISSDRLQEAIIWSEILGKPLSKRRNRRSKG